MSAMSRDIRVTFVGDSFVQGVGDPKHRGWVGRVLAATCGTVTGFNLGVRGETSEDITRRCWREVDVRMLPGADNRLVTSFGTNDMIEQDGRIRVDPPRAVANLAKLLSESERRGLRTLVVGPPPIADAGNDHLIRTLQLADEMSAVCRARGIPFIATTKTLADDLAWTSEALAGDGAHPGRGGYKRMTDIILKSSWNEWISSNRGR
jgi:acyl-CoA thioesterase I